MPGGTGRCWRRDHGRRPADLGAGHLRWRAAGVRAVVLEPELVQLLREHKLASKWSQPDDFVCAGKYRHQPRERNGLRKRVLYSTVERANERLVAEGRPPIPEGITFHALRRTYAALRAELGEHPAGSTPSRPTVPAIGLRSPDRPGDAGGDGRPRGLQSKALKP